MSKDKQSSPWSLRKKVGVFVAAVTLVAIALFVGSLWFVGWVSPGGC